MVDAFLDGGDRGAWARTQLGQEPAAAPHLLDVEVLSAVRKLVLRSEITQTRADEAIADLRALRLHRYGVVHLIEPIWRLSPTLVPYDAAYVALAAVLGCDLVTTDQRLARAPNLPVRVRTTTDSPSRRSN